MWSKIFHTLWNSKPVCSSFAFVAHMIATTMRSSDESLFLWNVALFLKIASSISFYLHVLPHIIYSEVLPLLAINNRWAKLIFFWVRVPLWAKAHLHFYVALPSFEIYKLYSQYHYYETITWYGQHQLHPILDPKFYDWLIELYKNLRETIVFTALWFLLFYFISTKGKSSEFKNYWAVRESSTSG